MIRVTLEEAELDENSHFKEWRVVKSFLMRTSAQQLFNEMQASFRDIKDCIILQEEEKEEAPL